MGKLTDERILELAKDRFGWAYSLGGFDDAAKDFARAIEAELSAAPASQQEAMPQSAIEFDDFLNEPPENESMRTVREFRHAAYLKWVRVLKDMRALKRPVAQQEQDKDAERYRRLRNALKRLEHAVNLHLGRSAHTQTNRLKGYLHSEEVRKELYAAHDEAREALATQPQAAPEAQSREQVVSKALRVLRKTYDLNMLILKRYPEKTDHKHQEIAYGLSDAIHLLQDNPGE